MSTKSKIIEVIGIVASGKTTLSKKLATLLQMEYVDIDLYLDNPILTSVSSNRERFSFVTGLHFSYERSKKIQDVQKLMKKRSVILDQGFDMGLYTYSANAFQQKLMTKEEYEFLVTLHKDFMKDSPIIDTTIILDPSIESIFSRIKNRGREHEKQYSAQYIRGLMAEFHKYINVLQSGRSRKTVIICSSNKEIYTIGKKQEKLVTILKQNI